MRTIRLTVATPVHAVPPPLAALGARALAGGAALEIEVAPGGTVAPLLAAVAAAGLSVVDVETRRVTLEDVFVRLVAAGAREGNP
jgi:ABC-2 type transport system ATP-binding protein